MAPTITKKTPAKAAAKAKSDADADTDTANGTNEGRQYWLMKAEPETRYENGVDVSFSIDDLAGKQKPEPWDGASRSPFCLLLMDTSHMLIRWRRRYQKLRW